MFLSWFVCFLFLSLNVFFMATVIAEPGSVKRFLTTRRTKNQVVKGRSLVFAVPLAAEFGDFRGSRKMFGILREKCSRHILNIS